MSKKPLYTPGPWRVSQWGSSVIAGEQERPYSHIVSTPFTNGTEGPVLPSAEQIANAQLIAAAPELLEALQQCLHILAGEALSKSALEHALRKGLAACHKATGEPS